MDRFLSFLLAGIVVFLIRGCWHDEPRYSYKPNYDYKFPSVRLPQNYYVKMPSDSLLSSSAIKVRNVDPILLTDDIRILDTETYIDTTHVLFADNKPIADILSDVDTQDFQPEAFSVDSVAIE